MTPPCSDAREPPQPAAVDLLWLPLGAGGHSVRLNGRVYEALAAWVQHRARRDLYHSALEIQVGGERYVIEMAPVPDRHGGARGVVAEGPVGSRWAGGLRIFRYEIRRWRGGTIPDAGEAVDSPRRLSTDESVARRILAAAPGVPRFVWGRDATATGEMWNCNSVIAWLLERAGLDADAVAPPPGGRAPGWRAGTAAARAASR